jgi:hypothetical protein
VTTPNLEPPAGHSPLFTGSHADHSRRCRNVAPITLFVVELSKGGMINWQYMNHPTEMVYLGGIKQKLVSASRQRTSSDGHFALATICREGYSQLLSASAFLASSDFVSARYGFVYANGPQSSIHPPKKNSAR